MRGQSVHGGHRPVRKPNDSALILCQLNKELRLSVLPGAAENTPLCKGNQFHFKQKRNVAEIQSSG